MLRAVTTELVLTMKRRKGMKAMTMVMAMTTKIMMMVISFLKKGVAAAHQGGGGCD